MILPERPSLSTYMTRLLSAGRVVFSSGEAREALGVGHGALLDAAERQQRRRHLFAPRRGFYVVVPPQYHTWGAPPPTWYIDDLMRHEGRPYYVGLLKAAELHGAAHQAVMEFQVITDQRLPDIRAGRSLVRFYYRKDLGAVDAAVERHVTDTGHMSVSSVELTILDLVRYPHAAGGLDNVANVISAIGERIEGGRLAHVSSAFERSVLQRTGHLLDRLGHSDRADRLFEVASKARTFPWIELDPAQSGDPDLSPEVISRDERWRVVVRRPPVLDE